jgi:hypothetical protein
VGVFSRIVVVAPETVRLDLGDGHWVEVKKQLTYGEMSDVAEATKGSLVTAQIHMLAAYIVDWSLQDAKEQRLPVDSLAERIGSLRAMTPEAVNAIDAVIETHSKGVQDAKKAEAPSGRKRSARI